jgi:hypothetical protein
MTTIQSFLDHGKKRKITKPYGKNPLLKDSEPRGPLSKINVLNSPENKMQCQARTDRAGRAAILKQKQNNKFLTLEESRNIQLKKQNDNSPHKVDFDTSTHSDESQLSKASPTKKTTGRAVSVNLMGITQGFDPNKPTVALVPLCTAAGKPIPKNDMGKSHEKMIRKTIGKIFELKDKFATQGGDSELKSLTSFRVAVSKATFHNPKSYFEQEKHRNLISQCFRGQIESSKEKITDTPDQQGTQEVQTHQKINRQFLDQFHQYNIDSSLKKS